MSATCPCGWQGSGLQSHYRWSPHCRPQPESPAAPGQSPREAAFITLTNLLRTLIGSEFLRAHLNMYMHPKHLDAVRNILTVVVNMILIFVRSEITGSVGCRSLG